MKYYVTYCFYLFFIHRKTDAHKKAGPRGTGFNCDAWEESQCLNIARLFLALIAVRDVERNFLAFLQRFEA